MGFILAKGLIVLILKSGRVIINMSNTELFNANFDLAIAVVQRVEPALHQQGPLEAESCDQEVETHGAKAIALQKCHQETKSHKYHHMDILETCKTTRERREGSGCGCQPFSNRW